MPAARLAGALAAALAAVLGAAAGRVLVIVARCQMPPTPSPFLSPGLLSPAKKYSGMSLNVTCAVPWLRVIVAKSAALSPAPTLIEPPAGGVSTGQLVKHCPTP